MNYKIFFLGLNNETISILSDNKFINLVGVNYFYYFDKSNLNLADAIFRLVYRLHYKKKNKFLIHILFKIWKHISFLSSKLYRTNKEYLECLLFNNIDIIDVEDLDLFRNFLKNKSIDLMVINSWNIIPKDILFIPKFKTLNIHPSELPQYRGSLPTLWTLKNRDKESALTYLILNEEIDNGLIINQHKFQIESPDNWYTLEKKISYILKDTLTNDILNYLNGNVFHVPTTKEPSYTGLYNRYRQISLENEDSSDIYNKVGLYPYIEPFFYCYLNITNRKIYIKKIFIYKSKKNDIPGVIKLNFLNVLFYSKNGILRSRLFIDISIIDSIFIIFNKLTKKI